MAGRARNQPLRDESENEAPDSWRKFFIILTGITNGAHQSVVRTFKSEGQTEARSPEDADYCLVFCPVSSRVGTDVSEAMEHLPAGKDAVLVVMHYTSNTEQVIPPSRRVVTDQRVQLTLDCLFYQKKLLSCELNRNMNNNIRKFFRASRSQVWLFIASLGLRPQSWSIRKSSWRKFFTILTGITNGAHQSVVRTFKSEGQTEATSPEDADYCLVFCPVSSRVGTDVSEAMEHLPAGKAAVLVVMHHTFNTEQVIPLSRRLVTDPRVQLTLDCLFHQNKLLSCELNRNMENDIRKFFRASQSQVWLSIASPGLWPQSWSIRKCATCLSIMIIMFISFHSCLHHGTSTNSTVEIQSASESNKVPVMAEGLPIRDESEDEAPASWRKFFTILTGKTNGAHRSVVEFFGSLGQTEARSPEKADYCLVFCPISSLVGKDVRDAMEHLPAGKAAVLVVMHHTFNPEQVIPPSRRVVTDWRVQLTLDCLFYQDKLLSCQLNGNMEKNIKKFFRFSQLETSDGKDPDRGGEPGSKDQQKKTPRPPEDGNKKRSNKELMKPKTFEQDDQSWWSRFLPKKNKTSENDIPEPWAATCSNMETSPPAAPSESDVILQQKIKELHEEMAPLRKQHAEEIKALKKQNAELLARHAAEIEALKKQNSEETEALNKRNVEEKEALKSETDEEIANRDQKNQELWTDIEKEKKNVGFPVELHPNGPGLTNSGGGPGSTDHQNTPLQPEAKNSSSEETPQQDGLSRSWEEIDNFSDSWQIPERMKELEIELKREVDPLVKSKSNEVPAAPDVRGEPGSTDQEEPDRMETSPPAGPSGSEEISQQTILQNLLREMEALKNQNTEEMEALKNQTAKEKHHLKNQMEALKNQNTELQKEVAKLKQQVGFPAKSQSSDGSDPAESDGAPQRHVCSWNSELQQHGDSLS
ncbi:uncharacterized protein LOC115402422 isoform X11 [Salarias fasciatus]|uniref:uncharacterized protein LOC115402422 isoform X11 n=1 Tax=Salarias fasciatus TaxID=181472 RepID=UPI0011768E8E|nr:uncharacterized protein LOC115402422 isoform X11 [Salarias fasciatus]